METFQELIQSNIPVLVDFYADWCGPCKTMNPAIQDIGKTIQGKGRVVKINIDKNQALAAQFTVQSVPTFMIFKNGKTLWRHSGTIDKNSLLQQLLSFV